MSKIIPLLFLLLTILSCNSSSNVAGGVETGNGFTTGIVMSSANTPVTAIVKAVPVSFDPSQDTLDLALIDTTKSTGEFSITLKAGRYNLIAEDSSGTEIALSKNIEIVKDGTTEKQITLADNHAYTYTFDGKIHSEGDLYFEGTTFIEHYTSGKDTVKFDHLPSNTWYPPLHRVENGVDTVIVDGIISPTAVRVKGTDGFSDLEVLTYDSVGGKLWAGSDLNDGVFTFSLNGEKKSQDNYLKVTAFTYGITTIENSTDHKMLIGTGKGLFEYDSTADPKYSQIDSGSYNAYEVLDVFQNGNTIWSAFADGVHYGSEIIEIIDTRAMDHRGDSIFVGTETGEIVEFSTDNKVLTKRDITLPAIYDLKALTTGDILAATSSKLSVIDGNSEVAVFDQFNSNDDTEIIRIRENHAGEVFFLTENNKLFIMTSLNEISQIVWPESLQITANILRPVVDFDFDNDENMWLLLNDGALIKIVNNK